MITYNPVSNRFSVTTLLCILASSPCLAQPPHSPWQTTISRTTSIEASPDGSTILVTGEVGYLLRSGDSGKTWELPVSGTYNDLLDIAWVNDRTVYTAGANSHVSWSTDRGATWREVEGDIYPTQQFHHVRRVPASEGVVVLSDSVLLRGAASDTEWQPLLSRLGTLRSVFFYDSLRGVVSAHGEGILRTTDGGETWEVVQNTFDMVVMDFDADVESGYSVAVLDSGEVYESHDFGASWQETAIVELIPATILLDQGGRVVIGGMPRNPNLLNLPIAGVIDTADNSWEDLHITRWWGGEAIRGIAVAAGSLISVANSGGLYRYTDTAASPETISITYLHRPPIVSNVRACSFQTADTGMIVSPTSGQMTLDGGATWISSPLAGTNPFGLRYLGEQEGYIWLNGRFSSGYRWQGTGHALSHFQPEVMIDDMPSNSSLASFLWTKNAELGMGLAVQSGSTPTAYFGITVDTGKSFRGMKIFIEDFVPLDFDMTQGGFGFITFHSLRQVSGSYNFKIFRTEDSLQTLTPLRDESSPVVYDWVIRVHSPGRAFRCRQMDDTTAPESCCELMETTDGGETWHPFHQFEGPITLSFLTDRVWVAASTYARLWISYDAGETWIREQIEPTPIRKLGTRAYPTNFGSAHISADGRAIYIPASNGLLFRTEFEESLLGVEEMGSNRSLAAITIAPNPVRDHLHLSWRNLSPADLQVFDAAGERVLSHPVVPGSTEINLPTTTLPPGRYQAVLRNRAGDWIASGGFVRL